MTEDRAEYSLRAFCESLGAEVKAGIAGAAPRANEEGGQETAASAALDPHLVPSQGVMSAGGVERLNGIVKLITRKAFGYRTVKSAKTVVSRPR